MVSATIICEDHKPIWESDAYYTLKEDVHVWEIKVPDNSTIIAQLREVLNEQERQKALTFYHPADTWNFITRRSILRILLGKYLSVSPNEVEFEVGRNKKPLLKGKEGKNIHFNSSHSASWIIISLSAFENGVDVEALKNDFPYKELLDQCFSTSEIDFIETAKHPIEEFFCFWTRKEALIKATSKGIDDDLRNIPAMSGTHEVNVSILNSVKDWNVKSFYIANKYQGSVAYPRGSSVVKFFSFPFDKYLDKPIP